MIINALTILLSVFAFLLILHNYFCWKYNVDRVKVHAITETELESKISKIDAEVNSVQKTFDSKNAEMDSAIESFKKYENDFLVGVKYAERIQRSVIPNLLNLKKVFPQSFVYYAPRDIVSGDFYTVAQLEKNDVVVVADCTGHGVPGGFLTMFCITAVKDRLSKYYNSVVIDTAEVLAKLRSFLIASLSEKNDNDSTMEFSDGMDITLVVFDKQHTKINFSLANHNLYVCHEGQVTKYKGDRMPVGRHPRQDESFHMQSCDLSKGDMIYFCSDGIQDQIGGPEEQKFMTKRLQKMVGDLAPLDIDEQYRTAVKTVTEWKEGQEQFDDQSLIGIRV